MLALGLEDSLKLRQGAANGSKNKAQRYTTKPMKCVSTLHGWANASTHNQLLVLTAPQHAAHSDGAGDQPPVIGFGVVRSVANTDTHEQATVMACHGKAHMRH